MIEGQVHYILRKLACETHYKFNFYFTQEILLNRMGKTTRQITLVQVHVTLVVLSHSSKS